MNTSDSNGIPFEIEREFAEVVRDSGRGERAPRVRFVSTDAAVGVTSMSTLVRFAAMSEVE